MSVGWSYKLSRLKSFDKDCDREVGRGTITYFIRMERDKDVLYYRLTWEYFQVGKYVSELFMELRSVDPIFLVCVVVVEEESLG